MINPELAELFREHARRLEREVRTKRRKLQAKALGADSDYDFEDGGDDSELGRRLPSDRFQGDTNLRTMRALLAMIDERGYERSPHQIEFHDAFIRSSARVLYKQDWSVHRPAILKKNGWETSSAQVLVSTPRRFGKTFRRALAVAPPPRRRRAPAARRAAADPPPPLTRRRSIAIFSAALCLAMGCELVVFRRAASRCPAARRAAPTARRRAQPGPPC